LVYKTDKIFTSVLLIYYVYFCTLTWSLSLSYVVFR